MARQSNNVGLMCYYLKSKKVEYVTELIFDDKRKFRFDIAIPDMKLAIEYEGINSKKSGHTTAVGYTKDCVKYNLATTQGWRVLRYTALNMSDFYADLDKILDNETG